MSNTSNFMTDIYSNTIYILARNAFQKSPRRFESDENFILENRMIRIDGGRQTGKTRGLSSFVRMIEGKEEFSGRDVLYISYDTEAFTKHLYNVERTVITKVAKKRAIQNELYWERIGKLNNPIIIFDEPFERMDYYTVIDHIVKHTLYDDQYPLIVVMGMQ